MSLSYELAKKLKDAGFPQCTTEWDFVFHESHVDGFPLGEPVRVLSGSKAEDWDVYVAAPTLSELIEACGDGFASLSNGKIWTPPAEWVWRAGGFTKAVAQNQGAMFSREGRGSTPEEAVANLLLRLRL